MSKTKEIISIIEELNDQIFATVPDWMGGMEFEFFTNGYGEIIKVLGIVVWSSEDDDREWLDDTGEKEDITGYLIRRFNAIAHQVSELKLEDTK